MLRSGANTGAGRLYRSSVPALTTQSSTSAFSASSAAQPRHFSLLEDRVNKLIKSDNERSIYGGFKGLERETLRVGQDGGLSKSPHPSSFGASMTHPYITTDYSEQMPEFVTPAFNSLPRTLKFLQDTHQFAHGRLSNEKEVLWPCSMPPAVGDDKIIQIADYGRCNAARFKEVYRNALKLRYGARMQIISGIHFNYSLPLPFWDVYQEVEGNTDDLQDFISDSYFGLIRNFLRHTWVVSFLFGASPAVDKSFLDGVG